MQPGYYYPDCGNTMTYAAMTYEASDIIRRKEKNLSINILYIRLVCTSTQLEKFDGFRSTIFI